MVRKISLFILALSCLGLSAVSANAALDAVDIYSDKQLLSLIHQQQYLQRVKSDDCQLLQDIEARAMVLKQPLYQYLWGEMLNYGVCVSADPRRGMTILQMAAEQGSSEAMVKIAQYYHDGRFVIQNKHRAVQFVLPAAANGDQQARIMLVRLQAQGYGSPMDYEMGYHWLFNEVFANTATKLEALQLLQQLEAKMPASAVFRAQQQRLVGN
ncbi:tetratricopeptide repeat protein [Shewanella sp. NIFS-20-20]|uniref:tetratricopeptide repeat protein n=1 Tax=Shewanella sp. NIFS-20-20 TaxID=2853806 RepID=UPI001C44E8E4|nr:SEL1-like repeat protein [Shewanella sp. NIFS-20-20]MBV7316176.1 SEL1-like repeat protein [Shewanella sp. NIFS-20-20]